MLVTRQISAWIAYLWHLNWREVACCARNLNATPSPRSQFHCLFAVSPFLYAVVDTDTC